MLHVRRVEMFRAELRTRLPFRYGIATMTEVPHLFVRVTIERDGAEAVGIAADHLPPKWFTKNPTRPVAEEIDELLAVVRAAAQTALGRSAPSAFALWRDLYDAQSALAPARGWPPLLAHFGVTLIERAAIEAVARLEGAPAGTLLRKGLLGFDPGAVHAELAGIAPGDVLPAAPAAAVFARHTVGLLDPLTEDEIAPGERLQDGLPQSLEASIAAYGLCHFKLKVSGGGASDVARLRAIWAVLRRTAPRGLRFSIDGNEGFREPAAFCEFWREVEGEPWWPEARDCLLFVEQPWHRDVALGDAVGALLAGWPERPPLIIDESDGALDSLPRALALGYDGTSHKNCKGVFKGAAQACLLAARTRSGGGRRRPPVLSGEDLSNIGPVALLQDLAVQATLGITSVERNGQHYFRGLSFWPEAVQREMLRHHGDLFTVTAGGWPTLAIREGRVSTSSVCAAPFGRNGELDLQAFEPVALA